MSNKTNITSKNIKKYKSNLPFNKNNYKLMIIGIVIIFSGFFIMTMDNEEYGYGFLGLTLGPIVVLFGFIFEFFAIFYKGK
tara:strand:- start:43 stop:285 length:243 start_codon:yes stop_codon:yes gene_type:complete